MPAFVDASKVRGKRDPGYCYLRAGFRLVGKSRAGLLVWQMLEREMPAPEPALGSQGLLFAATDDLSSRDIA
jgi:hypothetical protein